MSEDDPTEGRRSQNTPRDDQQRERSQQPRQGQPRQGRPQQGQSRPQQGRRSGQHQPPQGQPQQRQQRQPQQRRQGQPPQRPPAGQQQSGLNVDFSTLPWISGALRGVGYFVTTYITLGIIFVADFFFSLDNVDPGGDFFIYGVGWWIYDSFFVTVPQNFSFLESELAVPAIGYTVIAAFYLFLAGRSVARSNGTFDTPNEQMALYGATVAVGYTLAAVAGAIVLKDNGSSPDLVESILLIGVIFPVIFGGLGGYLAKR